MPKLHLVGITPDHRGLVLSEHARAKRGDMVLEIDDRLLEAIEKAQRLRNRDVAERLESNALPTKRDVVNGDAGSRLSPREIQQRLRAGESVAALARSSGTDEAWIRRFAAPVLAEQAGVIERARAGTFTKRGVGPSAAPLGPAVAANVIDRGVPLTLPELEAGWGAYQHPDGGWHVTFTFPLRGRRQTAEWAVDVVTGELTARNKLASELGWRESAKKLPQPKPVKPPAVKVRAVAAKAADPVPEPTAGDPPAEMLPAELPPELPVEDHSVQALPLTEQASPLPPGVVREVSMRPARKTPRAPKAPTAAAKRAAAAVTETPERVVSVPDAEPEPETAEGSMPPTDLDVVDVVVDIRPLEEDAALREPAPVGSPPAPSGGPPAS